MIIRKITKRKKGIPTSLYLIWYGIGRFFIEGLRTDSLYIGDMRVSQLVSAVLVVIGMVVLVYSIKAKREDPIIEIEEDNKEEDNDEEVPILEDEETKEGKK